MDEEQKQSTQPLYEFVAGDAYPRVPPGTEIEQRDRMEQQDQAPKSSLPAEEEIRRGLIYPPPPSFYQNMQVVPAPSPLVPEEAQRRAHGEGAATASSTGETGRRAPSPEQGWYRGPYPPPVPAPPEARPPAKRSRTWIWLVASILGAALLISCGLCGWGMYALFSSTFQQVMGPVNLTQDYYSALQAKNYALAYSYLSPQGTISGLTLDAFSQQASARDNQYGPVRSYDPGQPSFTPPTNSSSPTDLNRATVTVEVNRAHQSYSVLLTMQKINGRWKIIDYDRL